MAKSPEEMDAEWSEYFNSGNGEALLGLYEPGASFVMPTGDVVTGVDNIAQALGGFFAMKPAIDLRTTRVIRSGDVAVVYSTWAVTATAPDGSALEMSGEPTVVLREQGDGTWRFVIDDPGWSAQTVELFKSMG